MVSDKWTSPRIRITGVFCYQRVIKHPLPYRVDMASSHDENGHPAFMECILEEFHYGSPYKGGVQW